LLLVELAEIAVVEQLGETLYVGERGLELVRYVVDELGFQVARRLQLVYCALGLFQPVLFVSSSFMTMI
jgi:hypothetical protein